MYIGIVTYKKDIVEVVKVDARDSDEATSILAEYVYTKYNKDLKIVDEYFKGGVIDTTKLKNISALQVYV